MAKEIIPAKPILRVGQRLIDLSSPKVMGIINLTPDSFFKGSRYTADEAVNIALNMVEEGATFIDLGACSTRPGAEDIPAEKEWERLERVLPELREKTGAVISVDTFRSEVAARALDAGADMINDVSGGSLDEGMYELIADRNVPYVLMHMRGTPADMNERTEYGNVVLDIIDELQRKLSELNTRGISDIIVDPGFGFAKSIDQNYELLKNLDYFKVLERPLLVGISRKSLIHKFLGIDPGEALNGTTVLNTCSLLKGASILRVHDVREAVEAVRMTAKIKRAGTH